MKWRKAYRGFMLQQPLKLQQAYPVRSLRRSLLAAVAIGAFVAVFLFFFQPFGLHLEPAGPFKVLAIAGYGVVSCACVGLLAVAVSLLLRGRWASERWTVGKEIVFTLLNFLLVGLANAVYTVVVFGFQVSLTNILYFQLITLAVGVFPVMVLVLLTYNRLLARNLLLAQEMNTGLSRHPAAEVLPAPTLDELYFTSETAGEAMAILQQDFLFAAAAGNYVELHYLREGKYEKGLIRSSLSKVEEEVAAGHPRLVRCHRTYFVNLNQVRSFSGNAQGLKLELRHVAQPIPVSRNMVARIKALL